MVNIAWEGCLVMLDLKETELGNTVLISIVNSHRQIPLCFPHNAIRG
jgi:hypothetical protein